MATFDRIVMCKVCPFRKKSAAGWLGDYTPKEVIAAVQNEQPFMCHNEIDYDDPEWEEKLEDKPHCAGALQMAKVLCKLPRDPRHSAAVRRCVVEKEHLQRGFEKHHGR